MEEENGRVQRHAENTPSDLDIVRRVLTGEVDQYRIIVERYQGQIFRLGFRFWRSVEDVQDYVQEVFLKAYTQLSRFRGSGRFYSWLVRLAYNHGLDRVARTGLELFPQEYEVPDPQPSTEEQVLRRIAGQELHRAVAGLRHPVGLCVDLFFFFDLSYEEVSRVTGIGVNTVKSHVFRAKDQLRRRLSGSPAEAMYEL